MEQQYSEPIYLARLSMDQRAMIAGALANYNAGVTVKLPFIWVVKFLFGAPVRTVKHWRLQDGQTFTYVSGPPFCHGETFERIWKYGRLLYHYTKFEKARPKREIPVCETEEGNWSAC